MHPTYLVTFFTALTSAFLTAEQVHHQFANMTDLAADTEMMLSLDKVKNSSLIIQNFKQINKLAHELSRNGFLAAPARKPVALYDKPRQILICEAMHHFAGASSALIDMDNDDSYFRVGLDARSSGGMLLLDAPFLTDIPVSSLTKVDGYAKFPACASEIAQDAASINRSWREIVDALNRV